MNELKGKVQQARPDVQASYNTAAMSRASEIFLSANARSGEKRDIGVFLAKNIGPNAHVVDLGGGIGAVLENVLQTTQYTPQEVTFLEPTDALIHQAQQRLSQWPITYIHASFQDGIAQVPDNQTFIFESNAIPNFGEDFEKVLSQIGEKLAPHGVFYSILPKHTSGYGDFNTWAFKKIRELSGQSVDVSNDNALLVQEAAENLAAKSNKYSVAVESPLKSEFYYPIKDKQVQEYLALMLIFLFDLHWEDPKNPPPQFGQFLSDAQDYVRKNGMLTEDGFRMGLEFQVLKMTRNNTTTT